MNVDWKNLLGGVLTALATAFGVSTYMAPDSKTADTKVAAIEARLAAAEADAASATAGLQSLLETAAAIDDVTALKARLAAVEKRGSTAARRTKGASP